MGKENLRKVKEVNGWKVNHPHSVANIFYAIFTLALVGAPLVYLFLTLGQLETLTEAGALIPNPYMKFSGLDLAKDGIEFMKKIFGQPAVSINLLLTALITPDYSGNVIYVAVPYFNLIAALLIGILFVFSFVLMITFIVHIIRGYLKSNRMVRVFASLSFVISLLIALSYLVVYFGFANSQAFIAGNRLNIWTFFYISAGYLVLLIIISILYQANFKDSIPEDELEYHDENPTVEHVSKVHEITKVKYEGSSTIPSNIESIGGHAFSENQNLIVANIPLNITKLGNGAFANCLKLKVVSIPKTVTDIGANCFFNCVELERINYSGSKDEWKKVRRGSNWLAKAKTTEVMCLDGKIIVNPFH